MAQSAAARQGMGKRAIRLFVVEDTLDYEELIKDAFCHSEVIDWQLSFAHDGEQALKFLFAEEREDTPLPNLILLDWNLPKVNGGEVLKRLKDHAKLRRIPVLVFSSSEADRDIHAAYDNHANGYIVKPWSVDDLRKIVDAVEQFWIAIAQLPKVAR